MNTKQKNTALVAAILAGLLSLPLTWLTIRNAEISFNGPMAGMFNSAMMGMTLSVTGFSGRVTFLFTTPIWLLVVISIGASVLQLMRHSKAFEIPKVAEWITAVIGVVWMSIPVFLAMTSGKVGIGVGWLLGMACAIVPLYFLIFEQQGMASTIDTASSVPDQGPPDLNLQPPQN